MPRFFDVRCGRCDWTALWTDAQLAAAMRAVGMLKRADMSDVELFDQLVRVAASRLVCPSCSAAGLTVEQVEDPDTEEWGDARLCQRCRQPIPAERVRIFPNVTHCAACQRAEESSAGEELDYCPRCGTPRRLVSRARGGMTRYVAICPQCGG